MSLRIVSKRTLVKSVSSLLPIMWLKNIALRGPPRKRLPYTTWVRCSMIGWSRDG